MDEKEKLKTSSMVFYCKDCGGLFFAAVKCEQVMKDKQTMRDIGRYLKEGHKIAEISVEEVRKNFTGCSCKKVSPLSGGPAFGKRDGQGCGYCKGTE